MLELILSILRSMVGYSHDWTGSSGYVYIYFTVSRCDAKKIIVVAKRLYQPKKWMLDCTGVHGWSTTGSDCSHTFLKVTDSQTKLTPGWTLWMDKKICLNIFFK